ncbi:hypothetical protein MTR_1g102620 [Medicago truncatula]|uniref:Uncharacterized protein n=1 Tax=Medicago truncatula TaxID=3880 RepID=A0A072VQ33_MEDTR|nr:hypothetical protein MTR_1g102620 [Medicago truncatula]
MVVVVDKERACLRLMMLGSGGVSLPKQPKKEQVRVVGPSLPQNTTSHTPLARICLTFTVEADAILHLNSFATLRAQYSLCRYQKAPTTFIIHSKAE